MLNFLTAIILLVVFCVPAFGQTPAGTWRPGQGHSPEQQPLRSTFAGSAGNRLITVEDLSGAFVKSVTPGGLLTVQLSDDTETTVQLSLGGATLTNEQVQDIVGGMVVSNTENGITVVYDDAGDGTGKLNFTVTGAEEQIELIDSQSDVTYTQADTADLSSRFGGATVYTAELDAEGTDDASINDLFVFQWRDNPSGVPGDRPLGIRINDTGTTLPIRIINPLTNALVNKTVADLTRYEFLFLSRQDGVFIQLSTLALNAVMQRILPASPTDDQIARYDSGTSAWAAEDLPVGYQTGSALPGSPSANDIFEFNTAATGLSDAVDYDGSTAITTAARGDVFKYDSTDSEWVKQSASGTGGGTDDQTASEVNTDTSNFGGNLSNTDTTVQTALDTIDDLTLGGSGNTNLGLANRDGDSLDITSSSGDDVTVPSASTTEAGLQAAADKTKLDGIAVGAQPGDVTGIDAGAGITVTDGGTATPEVAVTNPFTDADETKLDGIATGAQPGDVTGIDAGTGITVTDGGTATPEVSVTNPFEAADETKLDGIATGAEVNVQADWNEATTTDDAFIQNKPTIPDAPASWAFATGATGTAPPERLPGHTIHRESGSDTYDPTSGVIVFTVDGTLRDGDFIVFDAPSNLGSDDSVNLSVNINNTGNRNLIDREENRINETHLEASAWYIIQRDSSSYSVLTNLEDVPTQEEIEDHVGALVARGTKTGITVTYTDNANNPGQIDFNVTGGGGGTGSVGEVLVDDLSVDWDLEDGPSPAIQFSRALTDDDDLGLVYLDWREWATDDPGEPYRDAGTGMTVSAIRGLADAAPVAVNKDPNSAGNPINQTVAVAANRVFGAITLRFPRATAGGGHSDMRMVYIGNHLTDTDENLDQTETDITVGSSASLVAGRDYWIAGPVQGCATTFHAEKITVDSVDDGTTITATRGVDGTGLLVGCQFLTTSDIIDDDKRTFALLSGHSAHDNAVITFRLLGSGGGMADLSDNAPHDVVSGAAAAGSSDDASRSDHVHSGVPAPATTIVSTTYDSAGTVGSHANYARQDHRHGLNKTDRFDDGEAPENVTTGASSAGTDDTPARRDHVHGGDTNTQRALATGTPEAVSTGAGSVGTSTSVAREDHVHGGSPQPADSIVAETITATGTVGTSTTEFAREDHRHGINVAGLFDSTNPEDVGTAAPGTATTAARRDHVHGGDIPEEQIELIDSQSAVTYTRADTTDLSSRFGGATVYTADIDAEGTADAEINDLIVFQWRDNPSGVPGDRPLGIRINDTGTTLPIRVVDPVNRTLVNKATQDLTRYEFLFLSRQDGVFIQLSALQLAAAAARLLPNGATDDQIARYDSGTSAWVAEDLPAGYLTGSALPGSPSTNDIFEFNTAATGLSDAVDYDGTTAITTAARGDVFKYNGTSWVKQSASGTGGGGATNLAIANRDGDSLDITSSTGDNVTVPAASTSEAGLMAAADKTALNGAITGLSFTAGTRNLATADVDGTISGVNLSILREFKGNDPTGQHTFGFGDYVRISGTFYMSNAQSVTVTDPSTIPSNTNFRALAFLDNPIFTGDPRGPTPAQADNDTSLATTAYVQGHVATLNATITALTARVAALEGGTPPPPVQDHTNRAAISADATLDTTEFNAGTTSTTNSITIPTWDSGTRYVFLCTPDDENDITAISQGGINVFAGFQMAADVESHHCWRTRVAQNTAGSGVTYVITQ